MRLFLSEGVQLLFFPSFPSSMPAPSLSQGPPPVTQDYMAESKAKYPLPDYPWEDNYEDAVHSKQPVASIRWRSSRCSMIRRSGGSRNRCWIWHMQQLLLAHRLRLISVDGRLRNGPLHPPPLNLPGNVAGPSPPIVWECRSLMRVPLLPCPDSVSTVP